MIISRSKPQHGADGVLRGYRLYECTHDKSLVTVELPEKQQEEKRSVA